MDDSKPLNLERKKFNFEFVENKIRSKTFGVLTTINQDGTPHSTGIVYGVSSPSTAFNLYFFTSRRYKKIKNIENNPTVSLVIPFPHYIVRFAPSGTITLTGRVSFAPTGDTSIQRIFKQKRVLRLVLKDIEGKNSDEFTFVKFTPDPKILCHGVGFGIMELRKDHKKGGYSVRIPEKRREK